MSSMAVEPATGGSSTDPNDAAKVIRDRIGDAEQNRRQFEAAWLTNLAFVAGQQWIVADRYTRTLHDIRDIDPNYADKDLYTADVITEQRAAALGELQSDDDRPELLLPANGDEDRGELEIQQQINRAVGHGWEYEWSGNEQVNDARRKCVDLGVSAIRARFDPLLGEPQTDSQGQPVEAPVHHVTGQAITDPAQARAYVVEQQQTGRQAQFRPIREGRIVWETGSAFNILAPPGVPHEKDFPWQVWVRPVLLETVKAEYGAKAANLTADDDITSVLGLGVRQTSMAQSDGARQASASRLKDHVWLYTYYEQPTTKFPQGRTVVLAGSQKILLRETPSLPYKDPSGAWCSGIVYFHWWRLNDRFYSRSFIEGLKDPQRMINRVATQSQEIIDRGMPFILVEEDTIPQKRSGMPMEFVELKKSTTVQPQVQGGVGPGEWMYRHREQLMQDLAHASTLSALKLGENPANVQTYSQLALLQEQEGLKRAHIRAEHQLALVELVKYAVYDIKRYWPDGKQIMVAGDDNQLQAALFNKSTIPIFYVVRPAEGSAKPRSQAAQLQLVTDIWTAAVNSGATVHDPERWMHWYAASLKAGQPLDLPVLAVDEQTDKAQLENDMLERGEPVQVAYYDRPDIHIPVHRVAQDEALMAGNTQAWQQIETHVELHLQVAAANAQRLAAQQPPALPGTVSGQQPDGTQPPQPAPPTGPPMPPAAATPAQ